MILCIESLAQTLLLFIPKDVLESKIWLRVCRDGRDLLIHLLQSVY